MTYTKSLIGPQHEVPTEADPLLVTILSWPRPHGSPAEGRFRAWLAAHILDAYPTGKVQYLGAGSMFVAVPLPDGKASTTMFSCHIDTVDAQSCGKDAEPVRKMLTYDPNFGIIALDKNTVNGTCLGADDGVGVWIMLKLLKAKCPGGYMFHTGEECGGIGSTANVKDFQTTLAKFKLALAFDRADDSEVITHQRGRSECASDVCAKALCDRLNKHGFEFEPSSRGVFTDTANYRHIIPECFNLGVGYRNQHGANETLDYSHASALVDALCRVDWPSLPIVRDPKKPEPQPAKWSSNYGGMAGGLWGDKTDFDYPTKKKAKKATPKPPEYTLPVSAFDDAMLTSRDDIAYLCESSPEVVVDMVVDLTVEVARLRAEVMVLRAFNLGEKYAN